MGFGVQHPPGFTARGVLMRLGMIALVAAFAAVPVAAQGVPASALMLREAGPKSDFRWSVPPEATLEPALFRMLRAEAVKGAAELRAAAADELRAGIRYSDVRRFTVAAETRPLLALEGRSYGFTGGAHGSSGTRAVWFDRGAKRVVGWSQLFTDPAKADALLRAAYCPALDAERAKRRGGQAAGMAAFDACPKTDELTVLPVAGEAIYGLRVVADPYVAGPYAEGAYEVRLDLPAGLRALVKPAYRAAFAG